MNQAGAAGGLEITVVVRNRSGLHARPSSMVAEAANRFPETSITIRRGEVSVDAKSIMELLLLEASCNTELRVAAEGPRAKEALTALADLFQRNFGLES